MFVREQFEFIHTVWDTTFQKINMEIQATIVKALREAGQILQSAFGTIEKTLDKQDQSNIVTEADIASEKKIIEVLEKDYPEYSILAEESGYINKGSLYTWIIDPLDGTSNFASRIPWYGVIITLLKNNCPVETGILLPYFDEMYLASEGRGATLNGKPIHVCNEVSMKKILFSYCLDYSEIPGKTAFESRIIKELVQNIRNLRSTNSVTDFCYVADGRLGGCINQTTKAWDIAGPLLLLKEAGAKVTDIDGKEILFNLSCQNYLDNYTIVCAPENIHQQVMPLIEKCKAEV